ncbi:MAG: threonylcarbamoyl-AMP synthase [Lentisphaeria bacterium]|nr:threonylcarbamoyl-AMP synthase [Lentisphaeria bacterium]
MSRIFSIADDNTAQIISECVKVLHNGGVILLPTETVYGLVCRFEDKNAEEKIYQLKHRPSEKRLSVFVDDTAKLEKFGVKLNGLATDLAKEYCPGAITIISERNSDSSLGFRIPDHEFVLQLLGAVDFPLSSTSANRSGMPNVLSIDEALAELDGEVDIVIDGGRISADSLASTVVDTRGTKAVILRQGALIINDKFL